MSDVLILVASKGMNVPLGEKLAEEVKTQGGTVEIINLVDLGLSLYPAECEESKQKAIELTEKVSNAKSVIAVAPEYNGSIPPSFNNTLAWISTMREQLAFIGANVIGREILTHYKKQLNPESATAVVEQLLKYAKA